MTKQFVCFLDDLHEQESKGFQLGTQEGVLEALLVRWDDQVHAYVNNCPHLRIPLNWQPDKFMDMEGQHIQCFTHGALFQPDDGLCVSGPCRGESLTPLNLEITEQQEIFVSTN